MNKTLDLFNNFVIEAGDEFATCFASAVAIIARLKTSHFKVTCSETEVSEQVY